jgi:drug/metabolite transporter (DMT)-like permease
MRERVIVILAILLAALGWWGIHQFTSETGPEVPGAISFLYALLFLALTATMALPALLLNRRFAPEAYARDPWRVLRHAAWAALCVMSWAWLQMQRVFNPAFAVITILIFVAIEVVIVRLSREV